MNVNLRLPELGHDYYVYAVEDKAPDVLLIVSNTLWPPAIGDILRFSFLYQDDFNDEDIRSDDDTPTKPPEHGHPPFDEMMVLEVFREGEPVADEMPSFTNENEKFRLLAYLELSSAVSGFSIGSVEAAGEKYGPARKVKLAGSKAEFDALMEGVPEEDVFARATK